MDGANNPARTGPRIGYVLDTFPATSETFVSREVQQLLDDGARLTLAAIHSPTGLIHPETDGLVAATHYRPNIISARFWRETSRQFCCPRLCAIAFELFLELLRQEPGARPGTVGRHRGSYFSRTARDVFHLAHMLLTGAWIASVFHRSGVSHVHAHFLGAPATAGRIAALLLKLPFSISIHGSDLRNPGVFAPGNVLGAAFVLTCTAGNRDDLVRGSLGAVPRRVHLVYHGLDLDRFQGQSNQRPDIPLILSIGRLVPKKGMDLLIEACAVLKDRNINFQCEVIGEGPKREDLERLLQRRGLSDRVTLRGACSQEDVIEAFRRASVFVLPCRVAADGDRDGLPNVVIEALAMQVPVISTPVGAVEELIEDRVTGLLVLPEDPAALADGIAELLGSEELGRRIAKAGRRRVETEFNLKEDRALRVFESELVGGIG